MPAFSRPVEGQAAGIADHIVVSDELAPYYRGHPGWVEVVEVGDRFVPADVADDVAEADAERAEEAARVASLTGDKLDAAVKAAKIENPSTLTADEKRDALLAHRLAPAADKPDFDQES